MGDWTLTMKEDYVMERSRTSKFVIEPINDEYIEKDGEILAGPLSSLLLRNKFKGIKIQIPGTADFVILCNQAIVQSTKHFNCKYYRLYYSKPPVVETIPIL